MFKVDAGNERVRYRKFLTLSVKLAKKLISIGLKKNEVLTIISHNHWKYLVTIIAGFYIGAAVNLLSPDYSLEICKPTIVFCSSQAFQNISLLTNDRIYPTHIIIFDKETPDQTNFDDFLQDVVFDKIFAPVDVDPKTDVAFILTSSGATGLPKCVQLTHSNFRLTMVYAGDPYFLNFNSSGSAIGFLPFSHIFGSALGLASILYGTKLVIMNRFQPKLFLELIEEHKISRLYVVPSVVYFLAKSPIVLNYKLSSITDVVCSGAPLARHLERKLAKMLKVKAVRQVYGLTETSGAIAIMPRNIKKYGSSGRVINTLQIKVVHVETGKILPPFQMGEFRVKGGGVMFGYLHNEKETKDAFDEEGFFKTGDLGYYDEEGLVYYVDRLKDIIEYKGFHVSPAELENLLVNHPAVKEVGVVGKPDGMSGEVVVAFVVRQPNVYVTEEQLVQYVAKNIGPSKRLYGGVRFINEMPKSFNGKILRRVLKQML